MCDNKFKCSGHEFVVCTDEDSEGLLHCKHCPQEWVPRPELDLGAIVELLGPLLGGKELEGLLPLIRKIIPILL